MVGTVERLGGEHVMASDGFWKVDLFVVCTWDISIIFLSAQAWQTKSDYAIK